MSFVLNTVHMYYMYRYRTVISVEHFAIASAQVSSFCWLVSPFREKGIILYG